MKLKQSYFTSAGIIFLFCLTNNVLAGEPPQMPPAQVSIVLAKERLLAPTTQVNGSVISLNDSKISTQVTGELQWLAAVGSAVKKNDIIARIDPILLRVELQTAKAGLERLKADLNFREQDNKANHTQKIQRLKFDQVHQSDHYHSADCRYRNRHHDQK